ncbi:cyclase family protein [Phytomonospora endophytica]|uniref:Kynurenine formamidase n=1 Tax=Phytomonospora endophytica TaxID=714109 RepID=A0A841G2D5_9ACTN|nr:cyclase family protein [Phytomonospora endophytica]MBB6039932.1 kynurenine formamidase [Phytomonospora endophytica]GIG70998.1 cyclase [Phytomonospora endophytica]
MMRSVVDLSHPITDGMVTVPGLPGPKIGQFRSHAESAPNYAPGTSFQFGHFDMISQTGTYLDSPFHRYPDGVDLSGLPLASTVDLPIELITAGGPVDASTLEGRDVEGKAVLFQTGWDRHWGTAAYAVGHPHITRDGAHYLADNGAVLVGFDASNVDDTTDPERPAHTVLLGRGVVVVEHLRGLDRLPHDLRHWRFHAAPLAVAGMGTSPVRAYAVLVSSPTSESVPSS